MFNVKCIGKKEGNKDNKRILKDQYLNMKIFVVFHVFVYKADLICLNKYTRDLNYSFEKFQLLFN